MRRHLDLSHSCADSLCLSSPPFSPTPSLLIHPSFYLPFSPPFFFFSLFLFLLTFLLLPFFLLLLSFLFHCLFPALFLLPLSFPFPCSFPPSITLSSSSLSSTFFFSTVSLFSFTHSSSQFEPLLKQRSVNTTTENEVIRKQFISVCWNQSASGYLEHV